LPRCKFVAGSFFEAVPEGGDIYILKRVLVDWTDEEAIRILRKCRMAMNKGMRLLIIDPLFGPPNEQSPGHLYDMIFLLRIGRVRTEGEYSALLRNTGFRLHRIVPTVSDVSILESFAE
jgi:O-methyltransferase domain